MDPEIPLIIEGSYQSFAAGPKPEFWPERFQGDPAEGHGLHSFYEGLKLGMQLTDACLEKL